MNRTYALVWNPNLGTWSVADEHARRRGKGAGAVLAAALLLPLMASAADLPTGGQVVAGQGQIGTPGSNHMVIDQSSNKLAIDWQSFDIGAGNKVTFNQPGKDAIALNRVLGADGSKIMGQLDANGRVFIVNPNGVLFGKDAQVNVGGLVASTLDISNSDLEAGKYAFKGNGKNAAVINNGKINATDGGSVALLGGTVSNNGVIVANQGTVALAAGNAMTLDFAGDGLLNVQVDGAVVDALVENHQLIKADGGQVLLTANAGDALVNTVVNNTGTIEAHTVGEKNGKIVLLGSFDGGNVQVAGTLDASAPTGGNGGFIETSGAHVNVADTAKVTTLAPKGKNGTWLIDPNDFTVAVSGGNMTPTALMSAVQSGNFTIQTATMGSAGGNGDIHINDALTLLGNNVLTLNAERNININATIWLYGITTGLALNYGGTNGSSNVPAATGSNYKVNAPIEFKGSNNSFSVNGNSYTIVRSISDLQAIDGNLGGRYALGVDINASGTIHGTSLIGQTAAFTGTFAGLGHSISDLTIDAGSASQVGLFGSTALGSTIRDLELVRGTVKSTGNEVGSLVGSNRSTIDNVYSSVNVSGGGNTGGLVGSNAASISNVHATGDVTGTSSVGGLVGYAERSITNASASGDVAGLQDVGGLVGYTQTSLNNVHASGNVSGNGTVGGLVGQAQGSAVRTAYATGSVTSSMAIDGFAGGLIGQLRDSSLIGAYASGRVKGGAAVNSYLGGLLGRNFNSSVSALAWDVVSSGQSSAIGFNSGPAVSATALNDTNRYNYSSYAALGSWNLVAGTTNVYAASTAGSVDWIMIEGQTRPFLASEYSTRIRTANQLQLMAYNLGANYTLVGDIDASATSGSNVSDMWSKAGFSPVGDENNGFAGRLEGGGHVISGLTIDRTTDYAGLFGLALGGSQISNIGMESGSVKGRDYIGPLVGFTDGSVTNAYANTQVTGEINIGGLLGYSGGTLSSAYASGNIIGMAATGGLVGTNAGTITNAYATGNVYAQDTPGGLLGQNKGSINNVYSSGRVTGSVLVGGLIGRNYAYTSVNQAFWDQDSSGQSRAIASNITGATVTALNSSNRYSKNTYASFGQWAAQLGTDDVFAATDGSTNQWIMIEGQTRPFLAMEYSTSIRNAHQLQLMAFDLNGNYVLVNDIDARATSGSNTSNMWSQQGFSPVGKTPSLAFRGSLDGRSHVISGLTIDRSSTDYVGLFGATQNVSGIRNVGLVDVNLKGQDSVGGLVGASTGSLLIENAFVTGSVAGRNDVGGMVGTNNGTVRNAYSTATVSGMTNVGGLVGFNVNGVVVRTYANGSVSGVLKLGGLVGSNQGLIVNSYYATTSADGTSINDGAGFSGNVNAVGRTWQQLSLASTFPALDLATTGGSLATWRLYDNQGGPLLRSFLKSVRITAESTGGGSKVYDGTNIASAALYTTNLGTGLASNLLLGSLNYVTSSRNAGAYTTANGTLLLDKGLYSGQLGYDISYIDTGKVSVQNITRASISAVTGITAGNKTYDGSTGASLNTGNASFSGLIAGDSLNVSAASGNFVNKNAADGKTVNITGITLGGADAVNYTLASSVASTVADIAKASLSAVTGITAQNRTYDGTTDATLDTANAAFSGRLGSDDLSVASASGAFADKHAADGKTVNISNIVLGGSDAGNYSLVTNTATVLADIAKASISAVTGITAQNRTYDGTRDVILDFAGASFGGRFGNDQLTVGSASGAFGDKNAGDGKAVSISNIVLGGSDAGNYTLATDTAATTADIAKSAISFVTGISAANRTYDGSTGTTLDFTGASFTGRLGNDQLSVDSASGAFANKNAGDGKLVIIGDIVLGGADAGNYSLTNDTAVTTADIAKASIGSVTGITAQNRTYDGTTDATLNTGNAGFSGVIGNDELTVGSATGVFANKNAGDGKTVSVSGIVLGGADADNYTLADTTATTSADIAKAFISAVSGITANGRTYDGTSAVTLNTGNASFAGIIAGDSLSVASATGAFADRNAGADKAVAISGITLDGADAGNYVLASDTSSTQASIGRAALTITAADASKVAGQGVVLSGYSVNGLIGGDSVTSVSLGSAGESASAAAGTYAIVASDALGSVLGNYDVSYESGSLLVTAAPVTPVIPVTPTPTSTPNLGQPYTSVLASNGQTVSAENAQQASETEPLNANMLVTNPTDERLNLQVINQGIRLPEGI